MFRNAVLYIGEIENHYLTGEAKRRVFYHMYALPQVYIDNQKILLEDRQVFNIGSIKIEAILCPVHTAGHMVYLVDDRYLFTGDSLWLGAYDGHGFINVLADDSSQKCISLKHLRDILIEKNIHTVICTGHTGWTDDFTFAFHYVDKVCNAWKKTQKPVDPTSPVNGYDESDDTEEKAHSGCLLRAFEL